VLLPFILLFVIMGSVMMYQKKEQEAMTAHRKNLSM
jgi:preprotein translocase subunit YajC